MQTYTINMIPGGAPVRVHCSQYDVGRTITFDLIYGNVGYTIPDGASVEINGRKADNKGFSYICGLNGSTVTIDLPAQMTAYPGNVDCELVVHHDGATIGSANFVLDVEPAAVPEGTDMSASEYASIAQAVGEAMEARDDAVAATNTADQKAQEATTSAAAAAVSETNARNSATEAAQDRQMTQSAKTAAESAQNAAEAARDTAQGAAATATEQATAAEASAQSAATSEANAGNSATAAATSAANAADSAAAAAASAAASDGTNKIPLVTGATAGNIPVLSADGGLTDSGKNLVDIIVAQGSSGLWKYIKWSSGKCICWGDANVTPTTSTASGNIYYSETLSVPLPFPVSQAVVSGTVDNLHWITNLTRYSQSIGFRLCRGAPIQINQELTTRIFVCGEY